MRAGSYLRADLDPGEAEVLLLAEELGAVGYGAGPSPSPDLLPPGEPAIAGTRIPVYLILNLLASEHDKNRINEAYQNLTPEDIRAALSYTEQRMRYEDPILGG